MHGKSGAKQRNGPGALNTAFSMLSDKSYVRGALSCSEKDQVNRHSMFEFRQGKLELSTETEKWHWEVLNSPYSASHSSTASTRFSQGSG
jgi:hypothetical protein